MLWILLRLRHSAYISKDRYTRLRSEIVPEYFKTLYDTKTKVFETYVLYYRLYCMKIYLTKTIALLIKLTDQVLVVCHLLTMHQAPQYGARPIQSS